MMDRPFRPIVAFSAALLLGTLWLAVQVASDTSDPEAGMPSRQKASDPRPQGVDSLHRGRTTPEGQVPRPDQTDWFRSSGDGIKTVLAWLPCDNQGPAGADRGSRGGEVTSEPSSSPEVLELPDPEFLFLQPVDVEPRDGPTVVDEDQSAAETDQPEIFAEPTESDPAKTDDNTTTTKADTAKMAGDTAGIASDVAGPENEAIEPESEADETGADRADARSHLLVMPSHDPAQRSEHLELTAREADTHTRRGLELAGRKAYFSARAEFVMALRLLTQGLDEDYQTNTHSRTLAAGLTALREADDFIPAEAKLEADLDLPEIIKGHRTPVLQNVSQETLTPMDAMQCYFSFAQEQLGFASGREVAASMALHGLGKLHQTLSGEQITAIAAARQKAVVFYQAALLACSRNYMASNDLGVVLAASGRYEDARTALEHSVSIHRQSTGWHNLGVVYQKLGQSDPARHAFELAEACRRAESAQQGDHPQGTHVKVQWVAPSSFAEAVGQTLPSLPSDPSASSSPNAQAKPAAPANKGRFSMSWPWNLLEKGK